MNRNLILAVVLSSIIYIVWFTYITPPQKPQQLPAKAEASAGKKAEALSNSGSNGPTGTAEQRASGSSSAGSYADGRNSPTGTTEQQASGSSSAGSYADGRKKTAKPLELETLKAKILIDPAAGAIRNILYQGPISEVNLIPQEEPGFLSCLENLDYKILKKDRASVSLGANFTSRISLVKKLSFSSENAFNEMELSFRNNSDTAFEIAPFGIKMGPGLGTVATEEKENPKIWEADYTFQEKGKKNPTLAKLKADINSDHWGWAGMNNRYFLFAVINDGKHFSRIAYEKKKIKENDAPFVSLITKPFTLGPGEIKSLKFRFYAGPKNYGLLKTLGEGLDRSVDFGFFAPLAKLANSALQYFYKLSGNYGIAIVLLSIVLQIIIFPLGLKSYKAMAIMKKIQPEMQALQTKYKSDPKRMNMEVMDLYKKHGANPLSGCWPMLLQIPVFFALFTALRNSWDLHGASFALWIKDLSAADSLFGHLPESVPLAGGMTLGGPLPFIMGALMFLQQTMSPQPAGDPTQAKIMKWMPVLFTFMFLSFPSGLVIYWIINSLFSIGQTLYLKKAAN
ncbi:MAG: hypothetical protein COT17_07585 [Elusimicrobia bacterium CG08_land_8_20_14_0_20_51_18]|nr:MAG: hypothetical protein COT17_07585 [Elusimicrobia bacterium CG08_land_8_20_14_0_20_51_18]